MLKILSHADMSSWFLRGPASVPGYCQGLCWINSMMKFKEVGRLKNAEATFLVNETFIKSLTCYLLRVIPGLNYSIVNLWWSTQGGKDSSRQTEHAHKNFVCTLCHNII